MIECPECGNHVPLEDEVLMADGAYHVACAHAWLARQPARVIPGPSPDARFRSPDDLEDEDGARLVDEIKAERDGE